MGISKIKLPGMQSSTNITPYWKNIKDKPNLFTPAIDEDENLVLSDLYLPEEDWIQQRGVLTWTWGRINTNTGQPQDGNHIRIKSAPIEIKNYKIEASEDLFFHIFFYDDQNNFLGYTNEPFNGSLILSTVVPAAAAKFRILIKNGTDTDLNFSSSENVKLFLMENENLKQQVEDLDNYLFPNLIDDFEVGGIIVTSGVESSNVARMRSGYHLLTQMDIQWNSNLFQYTICYFDKNKALIKYSDWFSTSKIISRNDEPDAKYVRFIIRNATSSTGYNFNTDPTFPQDRCIIRSRDFDDDFECGYSELQYDAPENLGMRNVQKNAYQLTDITYTLVNSLNLHNGEEILTTYDAGTTQKGMVYSSTREEENFVPQTASFHTFMTAVMNPNSYLYTRQSMMSAQRIYYGAVCSTFVGHCYGIDYTIPTTYMFDEIEGMQKNKNQTVYDLKIGDLLCEKKKHVAVVTNILRNVKTGEVLQISVSEGWKPFARTTTITAAQFTNKYFNDGFVAYRWDKIADVIHTPSPWIDSEEEPIYNTVLSPRRGDKANWRPDEPIEVDILDVQNYTSWELFKDDTQYSTGEIDGSLITFAADLPEGSYKLRLTNGTENSDFVYWIKMNPVMEYERFKNGYINIVLQSSIGEPVSLNWNYNLDYENSSDKKRSSIKNAIFRVDKIESAWVPAEQKYTCVVNAQTIDPGIFDLRIAFKTPYGLYWGDVFTVSFNSTVNTINENYLLSEYYTSQFEKEYKKLDYLQINNLSEIKTGLFSQRDTIFTIRTFPTENLNSFNLFTCKNSQDNIYYRIYWEGQELKAEEKRKNNTLKSGKMFVYSGQAPQKIFYAIFPGNGAFRGFETIREEVVVASGVFASTDPSFYNMYSSSPSEIILFGKTDDNLTNYKNNKINIYSLGIFSSQGEYSREYIPVMRRVDGAMGLYEVYEERFYPMSNHWVEEFGG